jgi:hypothetical protein
MTHELSRNAMLAFLGVFIVFAICCLLRVFLMKKIVQSSGGIWDINSPFRNVREERKALRNLPQGKLRTELRLLNVVAVGSWLAGLAIGVTQSYKK